MIYLAAGLASALIFVSCSGKKQEMPILHEVEYAKDSYQDKSDQRLQGLIENIKQVLGMSEGFEKLREAGEEKVKIIPRWYDNYGSRRPCTRPLLEVQVFYKGNPEKLLMIAKNEMNKTNSKVNGLYIKVYNNGIILTDFLQGKNITYVKDTIQWQSKGHVPVSFKISTPMLVP
ncbi:MAG: hypothetical protein KKA19_07010 [Candidatus Margulisbacteria bacterium]|nr:hypothetical protein [Candidatus Margulisiibacteriota bacterium]